MAEIVGDGRPWTVLMAVDALQVDAGDPEVGVPELALDHHERIPSCAISTRVCVTELVRREPPPDASASSGVM